MTDKNDDGMEALANSLAIMRSPWDHVYHSETGALAVMFPKVPHHAPGSKEQLALEDAWESKAIAMHAAQETIKLPSPSRSLQRRTAG